MTLNVFKRADMYDKRELISTFKGRSKTFKFFGNSPCSLGAVVASVKGHCDREDEKQQEEEEEEEEF